MSLRLDVQPGGEWLLPFAQKKLEELHAEMIRLKQPFRNKVFLVSSDEKIFIQAQMLMQMSAAFAPQFIDKIRITAGGVIAWLYRLGSPNRMFLVGKTGGGKVLPPAINEPASTPDTAGLYITWNNSQVEYLVSSNVKHYLSKYEFDLPHTMHFVHGNKYLGNVSYNATQTAGVNWWINRTGDRWATTVVRDDDFISEPTQTYTDLFEPNADGGGFNTTRYKWDDFFAPYYAQGTGLSSWDLYGTTITCIPDPATSLPVWNTSLEIFGQNGEFGGLRAKSVFTFSWGYVTGTSGDYYLADVTSVQRVVVGVLDTRAAASGMSELSIDPATGRPALGSFRIVSDDTYTGLVTRRTTGMFGIQYYSSGGTYQEAIPSYVSNMSDRFKTLLTATGRVIHVKNMYTSTPGGGGAAPGTTDLSSAGIFVDGVEVYSCTDSPIFIRSESDMRWFDIYPVDNATGLSFLFLKVNPDPEIGGYKLFLYQNGTVIDTGIAVAGTSGDIGSMILLNDAEHIVYWDRLGPTLYIWRAGHGLVYDSSAVATSPEYLAALAALEAAIAVYTADPTSANYDIVIAALSAFLALYVVQVAPPVQYESPIKDVVDPLTFYADGYTCKVKWVDDGAGNRTYSLGTTAFPSEVLVDESGNSYEASNQSYIPFSAVPA